MNNLSGLTKEEAYQELEQLKSILAGTQKRRALQDKALEFKLMTSPFISWDDVPKYLHINSISRDAFEDTLINDITTLEQFLGIDKQ